MSRRSQSARAEAPTSFGPVVLGRAAHVHPVLVIFCFLAGGVLFGIAGVIMAMPVALVIKHILAELYNEAS